MMKRLSGVILLTLMILITLLAGCTSKGFVPNTSVSPGEVTKTSPGAVTIEVTPLGYEGGIFAIRHALSTHSIDMSGFDLQKQVTVVFKGESYHSLNKPQLSGHHNTVELQFRLPSEPDSFEILISDIPDVKERRLSWP